MGREGSTGSLSRLFSFGGWGLMKCLHTNSRLSERSEASLGFSASFLLNTRMPWDRDPGSQLRIIDVS